MPNLSLQLLNHHRHHPEQVAHDAVGGRLKDGRVGVVINGDNHVRGLHACQVLDSSGDAAGDIEPRADGLACLTDLM